MANMKICKHCKAEVAKNAKTCPKCGGQLGMPTWAKVIIILGVILFMLGGCVIGCTGLFVASIDEASKESFDVSDDNQTNEGKDNKTTDKKEKFTLLEHYKSDESNQYAMYIEGKIQNNKDKEYSYVQVSFTTYDAEGNVIGSCLDNVNHLDANGVWKFKAICLESPEKIARYEVKEITGW